MTVELELAASKTVVGLLLREDLPGVAAAALKAGHVSVSLASLAALSAHDLDDARPLFERALAELGIPWPGQRDAIMRVARSIAREIVSDATGPYTGAKRIWELTLRSPETRFDQLDPFVYAASDWEDRPEDRNWFEAEIRSAARELDLR